MLDDERLRVFSRGWTWGKDNGSSGEFQQFDFRIFLNKDVPYLAHSFNGCRQNFMLAISVSGAESAGERWKNKSL